MASQLFNPKISSSSKPIISLILCFLFMVIGVCPVQSARPDPENSNRSSRALWPGEESEKMKMMRAHLAKLNKPYVKSVQSSDGDIIDCVESDKQPAFDHPLLKGQKPLEPPERPKRRRHHPTTAAGYEEEDFQVWRSSSGESCPEGTIPIRRTLERDLLRASSLHHFGRKTVRRDSTAGDGAGHEHAIGYASGEAYYGAKASMSVWAPRVEKPYEFSLSQVWLISGAFGDDLNTIEAGWQVSPDLYGDNYPRFFTYWTSDAYQGTGCYNLLCSGFVQTNNKIAIGAAISPISSYKAGQYDISILIWKDPKRGDWWLEFGSGRIVGYWPSFLFTHLRTSAASMVQFGGEVVNSDSPTTHTSTQMGSGHFAKEGFGRASYFRNLQVVDWDNSLLPLSNLKFVADKPNCYDIQGGVNHVWGSYFYYGGPGRNSKCP